MRSIYDGTFRDAQVKEDSALLQATASCRSSANLPWGPQRSHGVHRHSHSQTNGASLPWAPAAPKRPVSPACFSTASRRGCEAAAQAKRGTGGWQGDGWASPVLKSLPSSTDILRMMMIFLLLETNSLCVERPHNSQGFQPDRSYETIHHPSSSQ